MSQFEQRCYRTKVDVLERGFPDSNRSGFENSTGKEFFLLPNHVDFLETHEEAGASCFQERTRSITKSGQRLGSR